MAEVGLPNSLVTRDITCVTINGLPYPPVPFQPEYVQTALSTTTPVGGGGSVILPLGAIVSNSGDFLLANATTIEVAPSSQGGTFLVSAYVSLDTTSGGQNLAIVQLLKNGTPITGSAVRQTINQNSETQVLTSQTVALATTDTIQVQLLSADVNMTATAYPAIAGPPPVAGEPALTLEISRFA